VVQRSKRSDHLGGAGGAPRALTIFRDARTGGAKAVRCGAWLEVWLIINNPAFAFVNNAAS